MIIFIACNKQNLDDYGGYYDEKNKVYRYVNVKKRSSIHSVGGLTKPIPYNPQIIRAKISQVLGNVIWLKIENREVYTLLAQNVTANFKNEEKSEIALFLEGISLKSVYLKSRNAQQKFYKQSIKVIEDLVLNKELQISFYLVGRSLSLSGIIFLPDADVKNIKQSLNYLLIKNGISPYILPSKKELQQQDFIEAQNIAIKQKKGIWQLN